MASPIASISSALCAASRSAYRVAHAVSSPAAAAAAAVVSPVVVSSSCNSAASLCGNGIGSVRWATSKAGGSTKNGRDSNPKFLGVKRYGGQYVEAGHIIVRQRGQRYGIVDSTATVALGRDHTVYALKPGYVRFWWHAMRRKHYIEVVKSHPSEETVSKYPIVRLADWELPSLLTLPVDTPVDPAIIGRLQAWIGGLNTAQKLAAVPRGVPLIGGVEAVAWPQQQAKAQAASSSKIAVHKAPAPSAAAEQQAVA